MKTLEATPLTEAWRSYAQKADITMSSSNTENTDPAYESELDRYLNAVFANEPTGEFPFTKQFQFTNRLKLVEAINQVCAIVPFGNEVRVAFWDVEGNLILRRKKDADLALSQYQYVELDKDGDPKEPKSGFSVWQKARERREFDAIVFKLNPNEVRDKELNLWRGFAIQPSAGSWLLMHQHLLDNVCQGNSDHFAFLMAVLAQMFQEPWRKIGICVVLRGGMGVGKSKVSEWLGKIIGARHAPAIEKPDQLTGRFTGQLEYALLARVEEGYYPGDPTSKAAIKHLITSPTVMIERKGLDAYERPNYTRVLITSNGGWVVPAGVGERRYFFLEVGDAHKQDGPYFAAIDREMENGGAAAFLHDLLDYDYTGVDFSKPPMTQGLQQQISHGFSPEERWLESVMVEGRLPFKDAADARSGVEWSSNGSLEVEKEAVLESYRAFVPGFRSPPSTQQVGTFLTKNMPGLRNTRRGQDGARTRFWVFPPLAEMRAAFIGNHPGYVFPEEPEVDVEAKDETASEVVGFRRRRF